MEVAKDCILKGYRLNFSEQEHCIKKVRHQFKRNSLVHCSANGSNLLQVLTSAHHRQ